MGRRILSVILACLAGFFTSSTAAIAAEAVGAEPASSSFVSEIRLGLSYHEDSRLKRLLGMSDKPSEGGDIDGDIEILFAEPGWSFENGLADFLLTPRPHIGGSVNFGEGTSHAFAGFAWELRLGDTWAVEGSLDIAVHDALAEDHRRALGCAVLARQSLTIGKDLDEHWRLLATVEHLDNFELCQENAGLTNIGARLGYRF